MQPLLRLGWSGQACRLTTRLCTQSDIEEMLWEVDEDCDQAVTWAEFQAMYHRCRTDQTGARPAHPLLRKQLPTTTEATLSGLPAAPAWPAPELLALAGEEPRRLFNVVQFVINDKYQQGHVALEEAMQLMYLRYGRAELDQHLEEIFGTSDINSGKSLTLSEFLQSLHVSQVKQLLSRDPAFLAKTYKPNVSIKKR